MIQIILLIAGIVYALRKPKLKALTAMQYPNVPQDVFTEWQALELKSINIFLCATWGVFGLSILFGRSLAPVIPGGIIGVQLSFFALFLVLLIVSAIPGSKAAKIKKQYGIKWP